MKEQFFKNKMTLQIILILSLSIISCNRQIGKNKTFNVNGVQFELPSDYNLQLIDSIRKEWLLTKKEDNILIINSGGMVNYRPKFFLNSQYSVLSDTISGNHREIFYTKNKDCYELNVLIGHEVRRDLNSFAKLTKTLKIDTNPMIQDSINYKFILAAQSKDNRFCMRIGGNDIDTLIKYFKKAIIVKEK